MSMKCPGSLRGRSSYLQSGPSSSTMHSNITTQALDIRPLPSKITVSIKTKAGTFSNLPFIPVRWIPHEAEMWLLMQQL